MIFYSALLPAIISIILFWMSMLQFFIKNDKTFIAESLLLSSIGILFITSILLKKIFKTSYIQALLKMPDFDLKNIVYLIITIISLISYGIYQYEDYEKSIRYSKIKNIRTIGEATQTNLFNESKEIEKANKAILHSLWFFIFSTILLLLLLIQIKLMISNEFKILDEE